ncbi:hypothetical protein PMI11_05246 [Rhizobium sp. CF142]|nr:SDR family oxidoreductase [Rhizobium sp. CF142]EJJ26612.1 hypothetical protein PMI11_05246 [Rhizobium sp. CF142]
MTPAAAKWIHLKPIGPPTAGGENNPEFLDYISSLHPMKRMASAQEIAQAALFLLSDHRTS